MDLPRAPRRALLVASTGGHLAQLVRLRERFPLLQDAEVTWATFDTPQSRSLLAQEDVRYVAFTAQRDFKNVASNVLRARSILRDVDPQVVISTGAAIAMSFLPLAARAGIETHYVESAARGTGPSLTGRLLARQRKVHLYSQYPHWAREPWHYRGSVFDAWKPAPRSRPRDVKRVVVTLGTLDFPFRRLVERLLQIIPEDVDVTWHTGATDVSDLGIDGRPTMPAVDFAAMVATADVVIAHAGCGSAISALEAGRIPVLVPREHRFGEHIDDHQAQIAADLSERGLAVASDASGLQWAHLVRAAQCRALAVEPVAFALDGDHGALRPVAASGRFRRIRPADQDNSAPLRL